MGNVRRVTRRLVAGGHDRARRITALVVTVPALLVVGSVTTFAQEEESERCPSRSPIL
jgi:hypothetical protein